MHLEVHDINRTTKKLLFQNMYPLNTLVGQYKHVLQNTYLFIVFSVGNQSERYCQVSEENEQ